MAITANNSTDEVVNVPKFYCGIGEFKVVAVNPDKDQLSTLLGGVTIQKDPNYTGISVGEDTFNKIVFFVKSVSLIDGVDVGAITRVEFLVAPETRVSQNGNTQFINNLGVSTWGKSLQDIEDNPKMKWYDTETAREAFIGEADMIDFIRGWANVANKDECYLETIDKIVQGDVKELIALINALSNNTVKLLLGVDEKEDGKQYQKVYMRYFGRTYGKDTGFKTALVKDYGEFKASFDKSDLSFKEYVSSAGLIESEKVEEETTQDYYAQ